VLSLGEHAPDIFLDIFSNDYCKIIKAFATKRVMMQMKQGAKQPN
jgi:hypothetical protein